MDANNYNTWRQGLPQDLTQQQQQQQQLTQAHLWQLQQQQQQRQLQLWQQQQQQQHQQQQHQLQLWQQQQQQQQLQQQQQQVQQQQQPTALQSQSQQSQQPNSTQQLGQQPQQLRQLQSSSQQAQQQRLQQPASVDSSGHSGVGGVGLDHREVVWPKLQVLKDKYLQDMKELYGMLTQRSTMPMPPEQLQKLKHYKDVLQRMIPYLTVPKERVPWEFNQDKVEAFEKQIVNIMDTFKRRKQAPPPQPVLPPQHQLQPNQVPQPPQQLGEQQQQVLQQQHQQHDNTQVPLLGTSVDSLGHWVGGVGLDHREVVWPKLQVLKDKYLQDMKELYGMLTQKSTMPMPPEQLQKLKHYKDVLQRMIPYLTVPKERVPREFNQDKVEAFEKQIVNIMDTFKRRKQAPPPQHQLQPNQVPQPPQQLGQQQQQQVLQQQHQQHDNTQVPLLGSVQSIASSLHSNNLSSFSKLHL